MTYKYKYLPDDEDPNTHMEGEEEYYDQDDSGRYEDLQERNNQEATDAQYDQIADEYESQWEPKD